MFWRRKPRITDDVYGKLMTSFGRVVDNDQLVRGPAGALAERVISEEGDTVRELDERLYNGATSYHLRLLAGAWIMSFDGNIPRETAEVFEEAVAWKFGPALKGSGRLAHRLSELAKGEGERDLRSDV